MFQIDLQWLAFPVNLQTVEAWVRANTSSGYVGNSADHDLTLWFTADPTLSGDAAAVEAYWAGLSTSSPEATGYQTATQIAAAAAATKAANLASATTKLEALGLSSAEIAAILG